MKSVNTIYIVCGIVLFMACSQSGRRQPNSSKETTSTHSSNKTTKSWSKKTVVEMKKKDGINQIPVEICGAKMFFIFDTGAGMVSISAAEAIFLYKQGTLTDNDFLGTANFMDSNGDISEGTIINLKTVKIGDRTLTNIQASVVHNMQAPLLLGQTVLEEFGKISIDNKKSEITFEWHSDF